WTMHATAEADLGCCLYSWLIDDARDDAPASRATKSLGGGLFRGGLRVRQIFPHARRNVRWPTVARDLPARSAVLLLFALAQIVVGGARLGTLGCVERIELLLAHGDDPAV